MAPTPKPQPTKRILAVGYIAGDTQTCFSLSPETGKVCWMEMSKQRIGEDDLDTHFSCPERLEAKP